MSSVMSLQDLKWAPLIPLGWLALVVTVSILFRRSRGKPILFFSVPNALFQERAASGHSNDTWWRRLGGASGCLVVALTVDRLVIRPFFPFNLMFLPEMYGLEVDVPRADVTTATVEPGLFRPSVRVGFRDENQTNREMSLYLRNPDEFLRLVGPSSGRLY